MKMRDGSAKMLAAAKYTPQQLEAAKSLHTSNCRMAAYMEYLQERNSEIKPPTTDSTELSSKSHSTDSASSPQKS